MQYDYIKSIINKFINKNRVLRYLFFKALDVFILRQWYVKSTINKNIKSHIGNFQLFYDAGAGFCQYSDFVLNKYKNSNVIVTDLKADFLDEYISNLPIKKKQKITSFCCDLQQYALSDVKADVVISIDTLEHIEDDIPALKNFYNSMNDNAILIISTPSDNDSSASFTFEHVRNGYSLNDLTQKVTSVGFQIISTEYSYGFWGKLYWKLIMKNSIIMLNYPRQISFLNKWGKLCFSAIFTIFLSIYLLLVYLPCLLFMIMDFYMINKSGNGIIMVAKKTIFD